MIILDTNVLSALMRHAPEPSVVAWLDEQPAESIWLTSITVFEARFGLGLLPAGKRRKHLEASFEHLLLDDLQERVLPVDLDAASHAATIAVARQKSGKVVDIRDTLIAGIAVARRATLATRNLKHFDDLSISLVNPWA